MSGKTTTATNRRGNEMVEATEPKPARVYKNVREVMVETKRNTVRYTSADLQVVGVSVYATFMTVVAGVLAAVVVWG